MKALKTPILFTLIMTVICGLAYPLVTTGLAQIMFPVQANGNLIDKNGNRTTDISKAVGSNLIGQQWTDKRFMKSRPSAVSYNVYKKGETLNDGRAESGSDNFSNSNPDMEARVAQLFAEFIMDNMNESDIPENLLSTGESYVLGQTYILPSDALAQADKIAASTGLHKNIIEEIINTFASDNLNGISATYIFETQAAIDAVKNSGGKIIIVSKVNLEILKRMNKISTGVRLADIPSDLFTQTGSGLDPHISPAAAAVQIPRLMKSTGLSREKLEEIVKRNTSGKLFNVFGQYKVNVLRVNLEIARELGI